MRRGCVQKSDHSVPGNLRGHVGWMRRGRGQNGRALATNEPIEMKQRMKDLQNQVDELKDLVNTLLSVICEEPDGVHTGAAPTIPGQSTTKFCM